MENWKQISTENSLIYFNVGEKESEINVLLLLEGPSLIRPY